MDWRDATIRQLIETPIFAQPFMWLKIGLCVASLITIMLAVMGLESLRHRS